jgi:hypothetical protein
MLRRHPRLLTLAMVTALAACGDSASPAGEAPGLPDTSAADTAAADVGLDGDAAAPDAATPDTAGPDTGASDTATGPDTAPPADPLCDDGTWDEALPTDSASLSALIAGYDAAAFRGFIAGVLEARYPLGAHLVAEGVRVGGRLGDCVAFFAGDTSSPSAVMSSISTVVHECGHFLDVALSSSRVSHYSILADLSFSCPRIGNDLARSRLNEDPYADLLPTDFYRDIYLNGDPDDDQFESGDQGFDMVLEEAAQYVNSLATDWALRDQMGAGRSISARDGILTLLWYTMRYLRLARLEDPATYQAILGDPCWREATLTVWNRAWFYLDLSEGLDALGIHDARLMELVGDPALRGEVEALREAHGCPAR